MKTEILELLKVHTTEKIINGSATDVILVTDELIDGIYDLIESKINETLK